MDVIPLQNGLMNPARGKPQGPPKPVLLALQHGDLPPRHDGGQAGGLQAAVAVHGHIDPPIGCKRLWILVVVIVAVQ